MWPFNATKSYLGVDIGAGGAKIVELKKEKNRPVLFTYGLTTENQNIHQLFVKKEKTVSELLIEDSVGGKQVLKADRGEKDGEVEILALRDEQINKYVEVLKAVCHEAKTMSKTAIVSLPVSAVFHAVVTLPLVDRRDFTNILNAEIKKLLPRPIDEMAIDYQILPSAPEARSQKILVNAVPRELVVFYTKIFQKSGLVLEALEPESVALQRALVGRDGSVILLIDMGAERTNFFIIDQTVPVTHHSIESGGMKMNKIMQNILGVEEAEIERMKHDLSVYLSPQGAGVGSDMNKFVELFMPVIDPIIKEIQYSFDLFLRQSGNEGKKPEKIVLTGGAAMLPGLAGFISDKFKIKCYVGDPWARVVYQDGLKPVLNSIGSRMSVAIGLALRDIVK